MEVSGDIDDNSTENLTTIFDEALEKYNEVDQTHVPINDLSIQTKIKKTMRQFENATRMVSLAGVFSSNEDLEEISTNNLKYLLLPALLGNLCLKLTSGERKDIIETAEVYFKDFLKRCNDYNLSNYNFNKEKTQDTGEKSQFEQLSMAVNTRADKIQRFKEQKELKNKLSDLKKNMENENADEEIKRNFFITMLKIFIHQAIDELASIEMEKPILEHMAKMRKEDRPEPKRPPPPPLKPVIITKDEVQKAVFGAGYPGLPTMTVQEFYDKRVRDGVFPDPEKPSSAPMSLQQKALAGIVDDEEMEREKKEQLEDDPEYVERMRRMDDYKDDHRRGWGNRMNRS